MLKVNDTVIFKKGYNEKMIAYTTEGKIIICKHHIPSGYAIIKTIEDKGNCFIVTAEHIIKDYYYDINYEEFLQVLPLHGFKIGYDIPFHYDSMNTDERQIFAYNLDNHCVIVAETIDNKSCFNSIELYCPNIDDKDVQFKVKGLSIGSSKMCIFNLVNSFESGSLEYFNNYMKSIKENHGIEWDENEYVRLYHYVDADDENKKYDKDGNFAIWENTIDRLLLVNKEVDVIFKNSKRMKSVLAKRTD